MVKKGRFTVELVEADSKAPFKEHAKNNETYVEAQPDAEYFVRIAAGAGDNVRAKIFVDGKCLGYSKNFKTRQEKSLTCGLWYFDGVRSTQKALLFAKAKVFNSSDTALEAHFWIGNVTVEFKEIFDTGDTHVASPRQNVWKGGDVGIVVDQTGPKTKGVMTKEGTIAVSKKAGGRQTTYRKGRILDTITLKYCSTVGLFKAGVLGPVNPCAMDPQSDGRKNLRMPRRLPNSPL
jgi:hypothetical protein